MTSNNVISFFCFEGDEPIEVQLEPEPITFIVSPGKELKFVGTDGTKEFKWSLRINYQDKSIQLFPDSYGHYSIEIFENDELLEDWYKYM